MDKEEIDLAPEKLQLKSALEEEREIFEGVDVPVLTISATYRKELSRKYQAVVHPAPDVVFSRAHYSMAEGVVEAAGKLKKTSHLSDPTNYVNSKDWSKVEFTETVGQLMARRAFLKWIKDRVDTVVRNKLPITDAIIEPLNYLASGAKCPIISLHYEVGNQLAGSFDRKVVQVVTDPHVRPQYLYSLPSDNIVFCVFDEKTKKAIFKEAAKQGRELREDQVVVTGPPVDPRISEVGKTRKKLEDTKPLRLAVCTGGLGQNLKEIKVILDQFKTLLKNPEKIRLFLYAGTHKDFRNIFEDFAQKEGLRIGNLDDEDSQVRILYEDSIKDANDNLIRYMFPWADGVVTKPSGDMAYDAAAAGCFLLFLEPWGEWEENIQDIFLKRKVGYDLKVWNSYNHFMDLWKKGRLQEAMDNAHKLPRIFKEGALNIVRTQQNFLCRT